MKYPQIQGLEDEKFRRLTGVKRSTFEKIPRWSKEQTMYRGPTINGSGIYP